MYYTLIGLLPVEKSRRWRITLTGCPALSLPCGFTASGLPVGLQLIGPAHADAAVIGAAALLERELGISDRLPIDPVG